MSVREAILSSFPFIHNMVVYSDDSLTLYVSSPFVHEFGHCERILYCNRFPILSSESPVLKDIDEFWHYFYIRCLGTTPSGHVISIQKPSIILFVTDHSQSVIQNIDTSLIGLSLAFTEAARAKLIRAFETDEMNTDQILYSPPTESATTPHHSITKTPTSSALFRIKPISDISELEGVKYCGQVFKSFLLFSSGSFLYVVDQHAAHERINLDSYLEMLVKDRDSILHSTSVSLKSEVSPVHIQTIRKAMSLLSFWKYSLIIIDSSTIQLTKVPSIDGFSTTKSDFIEYIDSLSADPIFPSQYHLYPPPSIRRLLAQRACKNAIRFNTSLSDEESIRLVETLVTCTMPLKCAHGRPTVCRIDLRSRV